MSIDSDELKAVRPGVTGVQGNKAEANASAPASAPSAAPASTASGRKPVGRGPGSETRASSANLEARQRLDTEESLVRMVAGDTHVFATEEAWARGLTSAMLHRLVAAGRIHRVVKGWYVTAEPEGDLRERHRRYVHALTGSHRGEVVASHHSALVMHGIPDFGVELSRIHLTHRTKKTNRRRHGYVLHPADAVVARLGPLDQAVPPADAALQAGLTGQPLTALVACDHLLHNKLVRMEELEEAAQRIRHRRGAGPVRAMLHLVDSRAESPPESLARFAFHCLSVPAEPQVAVDTEGHRYLGDFGILAEKLLIEVDGRTKYQGEDAAAVIMREKAREAALVRAGWRLVRLTWSDIIDSSGSLRLENIRATLLAARNQGE